MMTTTAHPNLRPVPLAFDPLALAAARVPLALDATFSAAPVPLDALALSAGTTEGRGGVSGRFRTIGEGEDRRVVFFADSDPKANAATRIAYHKQQARGHRFLASKIAERGDPATAAQHIGVAGQHERAAALHERAGDAMRGKGTPVAAATPTGETGVAPSPEEDYRANGTKAAAFKAWFGDWEKDPASASKVLNAKGEPAENYSLPAASKVVGAGAKPVTVYHGTGNANFDAFDKGKIGRSNLFGDGFYFTEDKGVAEQYQRKEGDVPYEHVASIAIPSDKRGGYYADYRKLVADKHAGGVRYSPSDLDSRKDAFLKSGHVHDLFRGDYNKPGGKYNGWQLDHASTLESKYGYTMNPSSGVKAVHLNIRNPYDLDQPATKADFDSLKKFTAPHGDNGFYFKHALDDVAPSSARSVRGIGQDAAAVTWPNLQKLAKGMHGTSPRLFPDPTGKTMSRQAMFRLLSDNGWSARSTSHLRNCVAAQGHDGMGHTGGWNVGEKDHKVWIAFEPNQIKSVDNRGTFDPKSDHMAMSAVPLALSDGQSGYRKGRDGEQVRFREIDGRTVPFVDSDPHADPATRAAYHRQQSRNATWMANTIASRAKNPADHAKAQGYADVAGQHEAAAKHHDAEHAAGRGPSGAATPGHEAHADPATATTADQHDAAAAHHRARAAATTGPVSAAHAEAASRHALAARGIRNGVGEKDRTLRGAVARQRSRAAAGAEATQAAPAVRPPVDAAKGIDPRDPPRTGFDREAEVRDRISADHKAHSDEHKRNARTAELKAAGLSDPEVAAHMAAESKAAVAANDAKRAAVQPVPLSLPAATPAVAGPTADPAITGHEAAAAEHRRLAVSVKGGAGSHFRAAAHEAAARAKKAGTLDYRSKAAWAEKQSAAAGGTVPATAVDIAPATKAAAGPPKPLHDYSPDEYRKLVGQKFHAAVEAGESGQKQGTTQIDGDGHLRVYRGAKFGWVRPADFENTWTQAEHDTGLPHVSVQRQAYAEQNPVGRAEVEKAQAGRDAADASKDAEADRVQQAVEAPHMIPRAEYESMDLPLPDPVKIDGSTRLTVARAKAYAAEHESPDVHVHAVADYDHRGRKSGGVNAYAVTTHRGHVKAALAAGKTVPAAVLADHPDLSAPALAPYDADAAGHSAVKPGLFGQPTVDRATGKQQSMFAEPAKPVPLAVPHATAADARMAKQYDPAATPMLPVAAPPRLGDTFAGPNGEHLEVRHHRAYHLTPEDGTGHVVVTQTRTVTSAPQRSAFARLGEPPVVRRHVVTTEVHRARTASPGSVTPAEVADAMAAARAKLSAGGAAAVPADAAPVPPAVPVAVARPVAYPPVREPGAEPTTAEGHEDRADVYAGKVEAARHYGEPGRMAEAHALAQHHERAARALRPAAPPDPDPFGNASPDGAAGDASAQRDELSRRAVGRSRNRGDAADRERLVIRRARAAAAAPARVETPGSVAARSAAAGEGDPDERFAALPGPAPLYRTVLHARGGRVEVTTSSAGGGYEHRAVAVSDDGRTKVMARRPAHPVTPRAGHANLAAHYHAALAARGGPVRVEGEPVPAALPFDPVAVNLGHRRPLDVEAMERSLDASHPLTYRTPRRTETMAERTARQQRVNQARVRKAYGGNVALSGERQDGTVLRVPLSLAASGGGAERGRVPPPAAATT